MSVATAGALTWTGSDPRRRAIPIYGSSTIGLDAERRALLAALERAAGSSEAGDRLINVFGRPLDGRSHLLSTVAYGALRLPFDWFWLASFHGAAICGRTLRPDLAVAGMERPADCSLEAVRGIGRPAIVILREGLISSEAISTHLVARPRDVAILLRGRGGVHVAGSGDVAFPVAVDPAEARIALKSKVGDEADAQRVYERLGGNGAALRLYLNLDRARPALLEEEQAFSAPPGSHAQLVALALGVLRPLRSVDPLAKALATLAACGETVVPYALLGKALAQQDVDLDRLLPRLTWILTARGLGTLVPPLGFRLEPHAGAAVMLRLESAVEDARRAIVESGHQTSEGAHSIDVDDAVARACAYEELLDAQPERFRQPAIPVLAAVLAARKDLHRACELYSKLTLRALEAELIQLPDIGLILAATLGFAQAAFDAGDVDRGFDRLLATRSRFSKMLESLGESNPEAGVPVDVERAKRGVLEEGARALRDLMTIGLLYGLLWLNLYLARGLRLAGRYADAEVAIGRPTLQGFEGDPSLEEEIALEKAELALARGDPAEAYAHLRDLPLGERSESERRVSFEVRAVRSLALALSGDRAGVRELEAEVAAAEGLTALHAEAHLIAALVAVDEHERAAAMIDDVEQRSRDLFGSRAHRYFDVRRARLALELATDRRRAIVTAGRCIVEGLMAFGDVHPIMVELRRTLWSLIDGDRTEDDEALSGDFRGEADRPDAQPGVGPQQ